MVISIPDSSAGSFWRKLRTSQLIPAAPAWFAAELLFFECLHCGSSPSAEEGSGIRLTPESKDPGTSVPLE